MLLLEMLVNPDFAACISFDLQAGVAGSNPVPPTNNIKGLVQIPTPLHFN
jgi:hypothetical protein